MSEAIRRIRAFATEIMKIATAEAEKIQDPDIRHLLSERRGEEYLQGGRLLANSALEGANYAIKMGGMASPPPGLGAAGAYDNHAQTKKNNSYQKGRDYASAGVKGALTGLGVLAGRNGMRGRFGTPSGTRTIRHASRAAKRYAGAGAAIAVGDRAYRHDDLPYEKKAFVNANPSAGFNSPASELATSSRTGSFKSSVVHKLGKTPQPIQLGRKFKLP